jgi:hypothetical protein
MLISKTYKTSGYREKVIFEPKVRTIYVYPFYPDRVVHHALMNILAPIWDKLFIKDSYSCRVGKGQHKGSIECMKFVKRNNYVLQCDISKFYPSINHKILMNIIRKKIKDENVLWLINEIVKGFPGDTNVPIGNYTSQWFGNLYMNELDMLIKHKLKVKDYIRYCDDFLIFGNDKGKLWEIGKEVERFCNENLQLNLSKMNLFPTTKRVDFLGYQHFKAGYILLRKSTKKRFKKKLKELRWKLKYGIIELEKARSSVDSILGWLKHANTYNLIEKYKIKELREYIMRGLPKHLNTKQDYLFLKDNYAEEYWKPVFQNLLDTRYEWFAIDEEDYIEDENHRAIIDEENDRIDYFEYRENENARIYQLGFTVEEVGEILNE